MSKLDPAEALAIPVAGSLCNILMDCLLGSLELEKHSHELLEGLVPIYNMAKVLSVDSDKGECHLLLPEITKCARAITDNLSQVLSSVKSFMRSPDKIALQDNLTKSILELAESVCLLTDLLNECSPLRMFKLLKKAVLYLAEMERLIKAPPDQRLNIPKVTQACEDTNIKIITVTTNALNYSKNEMKKEFFNTALDKLEEASPHLIDMAKRIPNNNYQDFKIRALQFSKTVASGFQDVMSALKTVDVTAFQKLWDTLNYVNVVIKGSKELELGARSFYDALMENAPPEELDELHQLNQELAQNLILQLNNSMTMEPNPTKRAFYEQAIWDLEDKLTELSKAANAAMEGAYNSPKLLENFYHDISCFTRKLCTGPEEEPALDTPLTYTTALTELSDTVVASANKTYRDSFISAQSVTNLAGNLDKAIDKILHDSHTENTSKIIEKRHILREQTKSVMLAAHNLSNFPSMANEQELTVEQDKLNKIMNDIHLLEEEFIDNFATDDLLNALETNISGDDIDTSFL